MQFVDRNDGTHNPLTNQFGETIVTQKCTTASPFDVDEPAANTAAVLTYAAVADLAHVLDYVAWSYSGGIPVGGNLTITVGGGTVFSVDIPDEGAGFVPVFKRGAIFSAMVVTLAAGGLGITGKVNAIGKRVEV